MRVTFNWQLYSCIRLKSLHFYLIKNSLFPYNQNFFKYIFRNGTLTPNGRKTCISVTNNKIMASWFETVISILKIQHELSEHFTHYSNLLSLWLTLHLFPIRIYIYIYIYLNTQIHINRAMFNPLTPRKTQSSVFIVISFLF